MTSVLYEEIRFCHCFRKTYDCCIQFCLGLCLQFHLRLCTYWHYFLEYDIILSVRLTSVLAIVTVIKRQKVNACGISPVIL